ncbi:glutathione S-transferase N-terminal domain-containing protein [Colwellia sp. BRX10-4]|uniref:glutaredoxin family protein n=1 Tax=Colwellia sp. BRX10-4 TaxID=2759843 RepID=UPI0015F4A537|nr:glutathione S-transferase N-terminal domain-containing protein [Colwellia sp. BRX10-4]MBA6397831.1 glutathione S-transferase N-terminal domain-containing protein [Colwellia sp. BRX10-4]
MSKSSYALYYKVHCPYCRQVIAAMKNSNVALELCDTEKNLAFNKELIQKGGKKQVPCLKVIENGQESWLYESGDIIKYLNKIT